MAIFTGAGVAIVTPMYADGKVNFDKLGELIEFQIAKHPHCPKKNMLNVFDMQ